MTWGGGKRSFTGGKRQSRRETLRRQEYAIAVEAQALIGRFETGLAAKSGRTAAKLQSPPNGAMS